jgi:hypothetical protein
VFDFHGAKIVFVQLIRVPFVFPILSCKLQELVKPHPTNGACLLIALPGGCERELSGRVGDVVVLQ